MGLNPKGLQDQYANYWELNRNHALIHYKYAVENPKGFEGYGEKQWGFTSSYSINGYAGHHPGGEDLGVISPTAALSSFPYTPAESMKFLRYLYEEADTLIGKYGPYDAYSHSAKWVIPRYLAIDQGTIPVMIENYRTGLLWDLFMKNEDVQRGAEGAGIYFRSFNCEVIWLNCFRYAYPQSHAGPDAPIHDGAGSPFRGRTAAENIL